MSKPQKLWWVVEDTLREVPGYMPHPGLPLPYWSQQLLTPKEADELYFDVIAHYKDKALSRVYNSDGVGDRVDTSSRYTHYYNPYTMKKGREVEQRFNQAMADVCKLWWDKISLPVYAAQILGYEERCLFRTHTDNSIYSVNGWNRNDTRRDMTGLLYLGDCVEQVSQPNQFSGGQLILDNLMTPSGPVVIRPRKGQFVAFPSHPVFRHQVPPVTRGYRVAFVNWWELR